MTSTYDFLKQEAASHIQSIKRIVTHLQQVYDETGDDQAKMVLDSLLGNFQTSTFLGSPATGKNLLKKGGNKFQGAPSSSDIRFTDRVKAIIKKASTKNGQRIETSARGHAGTYIFNIDAEVFCASIDKLMSVHERELREYLGGTMTNIQVTRVCHFIGHVVRMNVINDSSLQLTDLAFAFETYYQNMETVKKKLSVKDLSYQEKDFFNFFESTMKGVKSQIEAQRKQLKAKQKPE